MSGTNQNNYQSTQDQPSHSFEGQIPPIAEKEKRGKPVKRPKEEPYVRELDSKRDSINLPAVN